MSGHEALGRKREIAGALSDKAQSCDQSENSDGSQERVHSKAMSQFLLDEAEKALPSPYIRRHRRSLQLHLWIEKLTGSRAMWGVRRKIALAKNISRAAKHERGIAVG